MYRTSKALLGAAVALLIATTAQAQIATGQAYDAHGRFTHSIITRGNVTTGGDGTTTIRNGNSARQYDANGRLVLIGIKRGNRVLMYDRNRRPAGTISLGYTNFRGLEPAAA